jgi:hypothetical protein
MTDPSDAKLTIAIDEAVRQYFADEGIDDAMPAGWVLLVNTIGTDMEREPSGVTIAYPNGSMPWATALGIVEMGRVRMRSQFESND